MDYQNILCAVENGIATITINRPKALNALNLDTVTELKDAIEKIAVDKAVKVVVITGAGEKSFVAGADIKEMATKTPAEGREWGQFGQNVFTEIENMPQPVIAAINGFCLGGGCELAMSCDIRLASENASFGQPEVGLGITPGCGGTQRLARLVGAGKAKEMLYTARGNYSAQDALDMGLVNYVYPLENLLDEAVKLAEEIAAQAPIAVSLVKEAVNVGMQTDLNSALKFEGNCFAQCFATEDQKYGMAYFLDKNRDKPAKEFKNK